MTQLPGLTNGLGVFSDGGLMREEASGFSPQTKSPVLEVDRFVKGPLSTGLTDFRFSLSSHRFQSTSFFHTSDTPGFSLATLGLAGGLVLSALLLRVPGFNRLILPVLGVGLLAACGADVPPGQCFHLYGDTWYDCDGDEDQDGVPNKLDQCLDEGNDGSIGANGCLLGGGSEGLRGNDSDAGHDGVDVGGKPDSPDAQQCHPYRVEDCNDFDDDCDGRVDEGLPEHVWYFDKDGDGAGVYNKTKSACFAPDGYAGQAGDCDDSNPAIKPNEQGECFDKKVITDTGVDLANPKIVSDGQTIGVTWDKKESSNANRHAFFMKFDDKGQKIGNSVRFMPVGSDNTAACASLVQNGDHYGISFFGEGPNRGADTYFTLLDNTLNKIADANDVVVGVTILSTCPSTTWHEGIGAYLISSASIVYSPLRFATLMSQLSREGEFVQVEGFQHEEDSEVFNKWIGPTSLAVDAQGSVGMAWSAHSDLNKDSPSRVFFRQIDLRGRETHRAKAISDIDITDATDPHLVGNDDGFGVTWVNGTNGDQEVYFAVINDAGDLVAKRRISRDDSFSSKEPTLLRIDNGYVLAWSNWQADIPEIVLVQLDNNGQQVSDFIKLTPPDGVPSHSPTIAKVKDGVGVVWVDGNSLKYTHVPIGG